MGNFFAEFGALLSALMSGDSWMISEAMRTAGAWGFGLLLMLAGAAFMLFVFRLAPLLDRNLERWLMVICYLSIAGIIFVEVIRRFILNQQAPWSTTLPPFLFLLLTWFGCAYNVKLRAHLSFSEFRSRLPRSLQLLALWLDGVLWLGMALVVIVTTLRLTANSAANFQILLGTDNVMQWWFLIFVPVSFVFLAARAIENMIEDLRRYHSGEPMIELATLGDA